MEDSLFAAVDMIDEKIAAIETSKGVTLDLVAHNESGLNLHNYDQMLSRLGVNHFNEIKCQRGCAALPLVMPL